MRVRPENDYRGRATESFLTVAAVWLILALLALSVKLFLVAGAR
jgi:hypothetical protein